MRNWAWTFCLSCLSALPAVAQDDGSPLTIVPSNPVIITTESSSVIITSESAEAAKAAQPESPTTATIPTTTVTSTEVAVTKAPGAKLRGLDEVSGTITDLTVRNGDQVAFGDMKITVSDCRVPTDNPSADAFAHLSVTGTDGKGIFDGWMIASSPALSAMDHPRYDVWVLSCINS